MSKCEQNAAVYLWSQGKFLFVTGTILVVFIQFINLTVPWLVSSAIDALRNASQHAEIRQSAEIFKSAIEITLLVIVANVVLLIPARHLLYRVAQNAFARLSNKYFKKILELGPHYRDKQGSGDLISRLETDTMSVGGSYLQLPFQLINAISHFVFALILMLAISPYITLWALVPLLLTLAWAFRVSNKLGVLNLQSLVANGKVAMHLREDIVGLKPLRTGCLENFRAQRFKTLVDHFVHEQLQVERSQAVLSPGVQLGSTLSVIILVGLGGRDVINGELTLGQLTALTLYFENVVWPIDLLSQTRSFWKFVEASWKRILEVFAVESPPIVVSHDALKARNTIDLEKAHLTLNDSLILNDVSISIEIGKFTAICGEVGSGKSTLLKVIGGLLPLNSGVLRYEGVDVTKGMPDSIVRKIAYCPQLPFLFSGSLRANLAFASAELIPGAIDNKTVTSALNCVDLEREVENFSDGIETTVGERGTTLSGGQRQRVALARLLLAQRPINIMDGLLSAVDAETEDRLLQNILSLLRGSTLIVSSNRFGFLERADHIIVLKQGNVIQQGKHEKLVQVEGFYKAMWERHICSNEIAQLAMPHGERFNSID